MKHFQLPVQPSNRRGSVRLIAVVAVLLCLCGAIGTLLIKKAKSGQSGTANALTFTTFEGEFVASVNESGDIESSRNVEIRCKVKSQGKAGTAILEIVPEGSIVEEGDFLCQLDDSLLQDDLTQQKITVAEDEASVIQAESDLDAAQRVYQEYLNGTYQQEVDNLNAEIALAEETARRASEYRNYSEILNRKGYITKTQLEADIFAARKAQLDLQLANQQLRVYQEHTRERMIAEFEAEIKKQQANVKAAKFTLELSQNREREIAQQIGACRVTAPSGGMVVYANEVDRRGDASFVIEEGALIRDGQPIFRLPDPTMMQVRTKVNDSKINQIEEGQDVLIRVDTDPEQPIKGVVRKVSSFPMPRRWYQAPIEYEVFVDVVEPSELIRSGLRAKAEIFVQRLPEVTQAPLSSLVRRDDQFFVVVKNDSGKLLPRPVEIGPNNEKFVVIQDGLQVDEEVLVDPEEFVDDLTFSKELISGP